MSNKLVINRLDKLLALVKMSVDGSLDIYGGVKELKLEVDTTFSILALKERNVKA